MRHYPKDEIKYCPKCNSGDFPYQSSNSFKCKKCDFHFFINSAAAVACIISNTKGEILLTTRAFEPNKGMLDLPGGFVDTGETAEEAAVREIKEELNIDVVDLKYFTSAPNEYVFSEYCVHTLDIGFDCVVADFSNIAINDDVSGYTFFSEKDIPWELICADSIKTIIKQFFKSRAI